MSININYLFNPLETPPRSWDFCGEPCAPINVEEIQAAVDGKRFQTEHFQDFCGKQRQWHIERIAYLVTLGAEHWYPIWVPTWSEQTTDGRLIPQDGSHRLAAAIFLKLSDIRIAE
jgi:hypothetical protein